VIVREISTAIQIVMVQMHLTSRRTSEEVHSGIPAKVAILATVTLTVTMIVMVRMPVYLRKILEEAP